MKDRSILLKPHEVKGIMLGRQKLILRPAKDIGWINGDAANVGGKCGPIDAVCPIAGVGQRLWGRETFAIVPRTAYAMSDGVQQVRRPDDNHDAAIFRADWVRSEGGIFWRSSTQMPRWASRINLDVTRIGLVRLMDFDRFKDAGVFFTDYGRKCFHGAGPVKDAKLCPVYPADHETHPVCEGWMWHETKRRDECLGTARAALFNQWVHLYGEDALNGSAYCWVIDFKYRRPCWEGGNKATCDCPDCGTSLIDYKGD